MQELQKLRLYAGNGNKITKEIVLQLIPKTLEHNVFELTSDVLKGTYRMRCACMTIYYCKGRDDQDQCYLDQPSPSAVTGGDFDENWLPASQYRRNVGDSSVPSEVSDAASSGV